MRSAAFAATLAFAAAACAPQTPPPQVQAAAAAGRPCFHANNVNGFREVDRDTVDLTVGANEVYRAELFGVCPDVDQTVALGVRARGGSSWICEGADVEVIVPASPIGPQVCPARSIRRLTQAEIEAGRRRR